MKTFFFWAYVVTSLWVVVLAAVWLAYKFSPSLRLVEWLYRLAPSRRLPRGCPELPDRTEKIAVGDWVVLRSTGPDADGMIKSTVLAVDRKWGDTIVRFRSEGMSSVGKSSSQERELSLRAYIINRVEEARRLFAGDKIGENKLVTIGDKRVAVYEVKERKTFRFWHPEENPNDPQFVKEGECTTWYTDELGTDGIARIHCLDDEGGLVYSMEIMDFGGSDGKTDG